MDVAGKVVFLTGGAAGLGRAYSEALLNQGAKVFFSDVNPKTGECTLKEFQERFGSENVKFSAFDVTDKDSFEAAFKEAVSTFGHIDVMVNNAGILNEAAWEKMILINYTALVWGTKLATEHMRKDKGGRGGRVINISSLAGIEDVFCFPIYCGTKHAVRSYTCSLAKAPNQAELGVDFGLLCPDAAATDLIFKADDTKLLFFDTVQPLLQQRVIEVPDVVKAFMQLLQLEKMNGAMLTVSKDRTSFVKMVMQEDDRF